MVQTARFTGVARKITDTPGYKCYRYHDTDVVKVANCRSHVILDSGGYRTYTTKLAMNQALNESGLRQYVIYQERGAWFVSGPTEDVPLTDGMTIKLR